MDVCYEGEAGENALSWTQCRLLNVHGHRKQQQKTTQKTPHLQLEGNTFFFDLININTQQKASMLLKKQILPKQNNIINNIQIKTKYRINNIQIANK